MPALSVNWATLVNVWVVDSSCLIQPHCVSVGQSLLIDLLVSKGAVVNATDYHALTPLHLSCQKGYQGVTVSTIPYTLPNTSIRHTH